MVTYGNCITFHSNFSGDPTILRSYGHFGCHCEVLSRQIAELGIYPAVDPLDSTSGQPRDGGIFFGSN